MIHIKHVMGGRCAALTLIVVLVGMLGGCMESDEVSVGYLGVNHTDVWIDSVVVNGEGGVMNEPPQGGGGGEACCVSLPKTWRQGLQATIKWQSGGHWLRDNDGKFVMQNGDKIFVEGTWKTKTVAVPKYTEKDIGQFHIHFFPKDEVRVVVSLIAPYHPSYPYYPYPVERIEH